MDGAEVGGLIYHDLSHSSSKQNQWVWVELETYVGRDGRFSGGFYWLCSAWIVYVHRATGKKVAHTCLNGYLGHRLARTNFNHVHAC